VEEDAAAADALAQEAQHLTTLVSAFKLEAIGVKPNASPRSRRASNWRERYNPHGGLPGLTPYGVRPFVRSAG
jgi:hypothetical protein